jgi:hypothetical protein
MKRRIMPSGCEFICANSSCEHCGKGFNMTSPWPMGRIELVLNAINVKSNTEFRDGLIKLKNSGRKYACITLPNISDIETVAYRVTLWSNEANCLWQYDVMASTADELIEKLCELPSVCPTSGSELWNFEKTIKNGILCPHCNIPMQQNRWFSNEE